jgi:hypothetical protein
VMCPSSSSGIVAILGFYEIPRQAARRFEVEDLARLFPGIVLHVIIPLQRLQGRVGMEHSDSKCKTPPRGAGLQIHWSGKRWL